MEKKWLLIIQILSIIFVPGVFSYYVGSFLLKTFRKIYPKNVDKNAEMQNTMTTLVMAGGE